MASFTATDDNHGYYSATLTVTEDSTDINDNTSTLSYSLTLTGNRAYMQYETTSRSVTIDGINVYSASNQVSMSGVGDTITLASGTTTIAHESDGSKTIGVSFNVSTSWDSYTPGNISGSGTMQLTTLPRATPPVPDKSTYRYGETIHVTLSRAVSSFTHTMYVGVSGHLSYREEASGVGTSWDYPIGKDFAVYLPEQSDRLIIRADTYNGSTFLGSSYTRVKVDPTPDMGPDLTITISDPTGNFDKYGGFVSTKSKINLKASATPKYGASITSYYMRISDAEVTRKSDSECETKDAISKHYASQFDPTGARIQVTAFDSRGGHTHKEETPTILDWEAPKITAFSVIRCNPDGTDNPTGDYAKASYEVSVSPLNSKNSRSFSLKYKHGDEEVWQSKKVTMTGYALTGETILPLAGDFTWDIQAELTDDFAKATITRQIGTAFVLMDWHKSGTGMAIGKVSEHDHLLEVDLPMKLNRDVQGTVRADDLVSKAAGIASKVDNFDTAGATWTAPHDGILVIVGRAGDADSRGYKFVADTTADASIIDYCGLLDINPSGRYGTLTIPVIAGHVYKIKDAQNMTSNRSYFISF